MVDCKYQSFTALSKINDIDLLLESFKENVAPGHQHQISLVIFEKPNTNWRIISATSSLSDPLKTSLIKNLKHYDDNNHSNDFFVYNKENHAWYCAYYGLTHSNYALYISTPSKEFLVDSAYLQQLFHFYCHQLHMLHGTYHDALTGLLNRRSFDKKLLQLIDQCQYSNRKVTDTPSFYVMLDIDHFKHINDSYGHLYGDEVLLQLAQLMEDSFRDNDLLFRYGGEEFAVVLMNTNKTDALSVLERFRKNVSQHAFPKIKKVTISIGYTTFIPQQTIDETISKADSALYYCKKNGRNQTAFYEHLVNIGAIKAIVRNKGDDLIEF